MEKANNSLRNLPDDIFLLVLQYCEEEEIKDTREFQSNWVQECTRDVCIGCAISKQNLCNMNWIKERQNGICLHGGNDSSYEEENDTDEEEMDLTDEEGMDLTDEEGMDLSDDEDFYDEEGLMDYYYGDDQLSEEDYSDDEENDDDVIVKPSWLDDAMGGAMGNLVVMKWIHENGVSWSKNTFQLAVEHGDIDIIKWLYKQECPWNTTITACKAVVPVIKPQILQWMQANGCPDI